MIGLGSDHRGYKLKEKIKKFLNENNISFKDYGTFDEESVDYPIYGIRVGEAVKEKEVDFGIVICGSGVGISIAASKVKTVRASRIINCEEAKTARLHNDLNVLALSENDDFEEVKKIIINFINTPFSEEEKRVRRIEQIRKYENIGV